jgi:predicted acylesterase/phospholipase RssA/CRP-like cAMP-binding protein
MSSPNSDDSAQSEWPRAERWATIEIESRAMPHDPVETVPAGGLDPALLNALLPVSSEIWLARGEALRRTSEPSDVLMVVLPGALELRAGAQLLATRREGEMLGSLNVAGEEGRLLTVTAAKETRLLCVPVRALRQLAQNDPATLHQLAVAVLRLPSQHLRANPLFNAIDGEALVQLDRTASWVNLRGGDTLCHQGDPADALFVVVHGRLEVVAELPDGEHVLDILERNAVVGEMALLEGQPRSATVRAIRDSELIRIPADTFRLLLEQPSVGVALARTLAGRLRHTSVTPRLTRSARTIAVLPAGSAGIPRGFIADLEAALSKLDNHVLSLRKEDGNAALVDFDEASSGFLTSWLYDNEAVFRFIVVECEAEASPWTLRAVRQADLVLTVALSESDPGPSPLERLIADHPALKRVRRELVLLHSAEKERPKRARIWLEPRPPLRHHHVRLGSNSDFARLARWVSGRSVGVVLSGGGARGFAHIGALQALHDHGISVDIIGGASMGAIIGAQAALGWDCAKMIARNKVEFSKWSMARDITYPFIALQKGRNTVRLMKALFRNAQIEDLWIPYFCVSSNLSRAELVVHEKGPIWLWTRASTSVPGILPPVAYAGNLLVDGSVLDNLPTDLMRQRCPGPIVAVDVNAAAVVATGLDTRAEMPGWPHLWRSLNRFSRKAAFPNIMDILMRSATLSTSSAAERSRAEADLYIHPPVDNFSGVGWGAIDRLVEIGYEHACQSIIAWKESGRQRPEN